MIIVGVFLGRVNVIVGQSVFMLLYGGDAESRGRDDLTLKGMQRIGKLIL